MKIDEFAQLDVHGVRERFPSLADDVALFDGAAGSEIPQSVIDAIGGYLREGNANGHGPYRRSRRSDATAHDARAAAAAFVGASAGEICFGLNASSLNYLLTRALGRELAAGDEIVFTRLDHLANVAPWRALADDRGAVVRLVDTHDDTRLDPATIAEVLTERTRVVAFPLASNAVGTRVDAPAVSEIAHAVGALSWIDATHYAPHGPINVEAVGADVLFFSAYKLFGPHLGVAFVRRTLLAHLRPYSFSGAADAADALETGTLPYESLAGLKAALDYLAEIGWGPITAHEHALATRFLDGLPDGYRLHGLTQPHGRTATFALTSATMPPAELAARLAEAGIAVRAGGFDAPLILERLGLEAAVRIAFLHYNTTAEVERLLAELTRLAGDHHGGGR